MADRKKVLSWLEGLTFDDWRMYHSDAEVQNIAKEAFELLKEQEAVVRCKDCEMNNQCSIQFKFADPDDPEEWYCANGKRKEADPDA